MRSSTFRSRRRGDLRAHRHRRSLSHRHSLSDLLALLGAYPDQLGATTDGFVARFGFLPRPVRSDGDDLDAREKLPVGMHLTTDPNTRVPFVVTSCALCPAEMVRWPGGERLVLGIGNQRVRIHAYDEALARIAERPDFDVAHLAPLAAEAARARHIDWPGAYREALVDATLRALRARVAPRASLLARTRAALPGRVATIESFAVVFAQALGARSRSRPTSVGPRSSTSSASRSGARSASTAAAKARFDALVVDADIAAGVRTEWSGPIRGRGRAWPRSCATCRASCASRRPSTRRWRDEARPASSACAKCHGTYEDDGRSRSYVEKIAPLD